MKNLFIGFSKRTYIVCMILGLVLYVFVAEAFLRVYVIPTDKMSHIAAAVYESENRDVVIGDSQFEYAFRDGLTEFENLSREGMPGEAMEIIIREYYRHKNPGRVIIIATPQMLAKDRGERGDWGLKEFFQLNIIDLPFMIYAFEKLVSRNLADFSKYIMDKHFNVSMMRKELKESFWEDNEKDKRIEMTRKRIERQKPVEDFQKTTNFNSYHKILSFLKEKNASVCLLRMPIVVEYQELIRNDKRFLAAEAAFKEMAEIYGAKYVDFRQLPLSFDASFFLNQDHLNKKGRKLFVPLAEEFCFGRNS